MTAFDERARAAAIRSIGRAGKAMVLRRVLPAGYDPATGAAAETTVETAVRGVIAEDGAERPAGGAGSRREREVLLAAGTDGAEPAPGDILAFDGVEHRVVAVSSVYAGERPALHRLRVRA